MKDKPKRYSENQISEDVAFNHVLLLSSQVLAFQKMMREASPYNLIITKWFIEAVKDSGSLVVVFEVTDRYHGTSFSRHTTYEVPLQQVLLCRKEYVKQLIDSKLGKDLP